MNELVLSVLRFVPSWSYHVIFAALCWVGVNLVLIAPFVFDRVTLPERKAFVEEATTYNRYNFYDKYDQDYMAKYAECLYSKYFYTYRTNITIWTSSFGLVNLIQKENDFYDVKSSTEEMETFMNDIIEGKSHASCGVYPVWNKDLEVEK